MAYQRQFWKGRILRTDRDDRIRPNPEAPPMHHGPGEQDTDMPNGADEPERGESQPKAKGHEKEELPLRHAHKKPHRRLHQVLMAHALRQHGTGGTTFGTAVGGGAAGGGAGE